MPTRPPYHRPQRAHVPEDRPHSASRGYGRRWRKCRAAHLAVYPLCAECERQGRLRGATVVDHIRPHHGDPELLYDPGNWQSLCKRCHDQKTASRDGGFGRPRG